MKLNLTLSRFADQPSRSVAEFPRFERYQPTLRSRWYSRYQLELHFDLGIWSTRRILLGRAWKGRRL